MSLTPENEEEDRQMDIPVESPEEALAERISLEEVLHALPEQDRQLIRLRFYGNKTQRKLQRCCIPHRCRSPGGNARYWYSCAAAF